MGPPGSGKSWIGLLAASSALSRGFHVAYLDYETGVPDFVERCRLLGIFDYLKPDPDRLGHLRYVPGHDLELGDRAEIAEWLSGDEGEGLLILDSAGSSGCPDDGPAGVPEWLAEHLRPFTLLPDHLRPALLVLDHVTKNRQHGQTRGPVGSQIKLRETTGIAIRVDGIPWTRTEGGRVTLTCEKDRRGFWARYAPMASFIGSWQDGAFGVEITEPEPEPATTTATDLRQAVESAIYDALEGQPPMSFSRLKKAARTMTKFANSTFDGCLREMTEGGIITKTEGGRYPTYSLTPNVIQFPNKPTQ